MRWGGAEGEEQSVGGGWGEEGGRRGRHLCLGVLMRHVCPGVLMRHVCPGVLMRHVFPGVLKF